MIRPAVLGVTLAATALLSACSGQNTAAPATTTVTVTPPATTASSKTPSKPVSGKPEKLNDVNCSSNGAGKVGPAGGKQVDLIATATPAGIAGCTEAFTVIAEYYRDAPTKSEGTGHHLVVRGWNCLTDTGAQGTGMISCDKDGLAFHTGQS
jgi:hypothetical protein